GEGRRVTGLVEVRRWRAGALAVVDVLVGAEVGLHGVDVAAVAGVVADEAQRAGGAERRVEGELEAAAGAAAVDAVGGELGDGLAEADLRRVGDVTQRARLR